MIARKLRLPSSVVFISPLIVRENEFFMKAQNNNLSHNRFGFVVGKNVSKLATERNRIKRTLRSYVEKFWLNKPGGKDILFILKPTIRSGENIEEKISSALRKVGLQ